MLGRGLAPEITGRYRVGDIRHCFSDIERAREVLDYVPEIAFDAGLEELTTWLERAGGAVTDHVPRAHAELIQRGLAI